MSLTNRIIMLMVFLIGIVEANSNILVYKIVNKTHEITAESVAEIGRASCRERV